MWLECIGVVSGCCCKEVYRNPHHNYYFSLLPLVLALWCLLLCSFLNVFCSCLCYFCAIKQTLLKEQSRWFKNRDHANIIII